MSENENNNFESLRRLLVLKQHETPPPGYFNYFSSQVVHRIRAGDTGSAAGWLEDLYGEAPWMGKLLQVFSVKPVFAGALCLLLFLGIIYAERPDMAPQPLLQTAATATPTASFASAEPMSLAQSPDAGGIVSSTNPVLSLQPVGSLFGQQSSSLVQPVSLSLPSN